MSPSGNEPEDRWLAVAAETLYIANLLVLPGLAFVALLVLKARCQPTASPLARCHLRQAVSASLWSGALLLIANAAIIMLGGYRQPATWVIAILYFTVFHSTLVLLGIIGLAKALSGKPFVFPVVGYRCDD